MKWMTGVNPRDKQLLLFASTLIVVIVVLLSIFGPANNDDDPVPTSWGTGNHGAKAAYLTLGRSGYSIERWTEPLKQLASQADDHTVLILAEPYLTNDEEQKAAIDTLLKRGGRVLATGIAGAALLPHNEAVAASNPFAEECRAIPVGLDEVARPEDVRLYLKAYWQKPAVGDRTQYVCDMRAVVITYSYAKGQVTWWADSWPLQNRGIAEGNNLDLLLHSVGDPKGAKLYWDESLHGEAPSLWTYAKGTPVQLGLLQLAFVAALLLLSYARRSGPLRPDPKTSRASTSEFVRSLGGLFHKAHATQAAVVIAYQHLRRQMHVNLGVPLTASAQEAAEIAGRRMSEGDREGSDNLLLHLQMASRVTEGESIKEARALQLVQDLERHGHKVRLFMKGS